MADVIQIQLEKISDISKAEKFHEQLQSLLGGATEVEIDASEVERVDTSNLQLLAAFIRAASTQHASVTLKNPSQAFRDATRLVGLTDCIGLTS